MLIFAIFWSKYQETNQIRIDLKEKIDFFPIIIGFFFLGFTDVPCKWLTWFACLLILSLAAYFLNSIGGLKSVVGSLILKSYQILNVNVVQIL